MDDINEVRRNLDYVLNNCSETEKKAFHLRSLRNIALVLINEKDEKTGGKLKNLKIKKYNDQIALYLEKIKNNELEEERSKQYFNEYIEDMGTFMQEQYNFSFFAGHVLPFHFLLRVSPGILLDFLIYFVLDINIYGMFSIIFFVYQFLKYYKKKKKGAIYGPGY
ncbi:hypothetical protein [Christiangramia echinicola]|uniref:Uncharacterized protein n=1 Tax=Christiangramia echinicola TaxID=279359 RepID=A0A1H1KUL8_9FLAO|nr:hypothetical protein [Christiangramia echinicola]SDR66004.1 hypothetical protein SAMN04488552_0227 [Christiangramia echinicola]